MTKLPLRKIVREFAEDCVQKQELECGHIVQLGLDTTARSRRCRQCYDEYKNQINGMTVGELQGWFEDNVRIPGGLKSTDRLVINDHQHISIIRDGQRIGFINFETKMIEVV